MPDCIFCQIIAGKIPCHKIYEDDNFLGFLDIKPRNPGNSLLIPKKHYRWVYDLPNFGKYWQAAQIITLASIKALKADSVSYLTIGYEIPHAHIRIIPRFKNDAHQHGIDLKQVQKISADKMKQIASQIKNSINHGKL